MTSAYRSACFLYYGVSTVVQRKTAKKFHKDARSLYRSRIHERTLSLRFHESSQASVCNVYITSHFQTPFAEGGGVGWRGGGGVKSFS